MKSLWLRMGAQNKSHSAFVKESWVRSAADSEGQVSSRPLLGLTELVQVQHRPDGLTATEQSIRAARCLICFLIVSFMQAR
jgi:hypothetical protein